MPELPEVETVKNILEPLIKGKTIEYVDVFYDRLVQSNINEFKEKLKGQTFLYLSRYGKFLFFHLSNDLVIISHLRMEGKYRYTKEENPRIKATSALFHLTDGSYLAYDDTRKFGLMYLTNENNYQNVAMIAKLGVEANKVQDSDLPLLYKKFNKKKAIKELLLDQTILCGIGNIYADEILYQCKINPLTKGNELTNEDINNIAKYAKITLEKAINLGGSTIHSFHPSEGVDGRFQEKLLAYGRAGEICPNCGTTFHKIFIGGRGTTFCPNCQINHELEKAIGITGPIGSGKSTILNYLKEKSYNTYSCDELVHELYRDSLHKTKISKILHHPFDIDNPALVNKTRQIMIDNPEIKKSVENYIYPVLEQKLLQILAQNEKIAIEAPTLFKAHIEYLFKKILVIQISEEQQIKNLKNRNDDIKSSKSLNKDYSYIKSDKIKIIKATGDFKTLFKQVDEALI